MHLLPGVADEWHLPVQVQPGNKALPVSPDKWTLPVLPDKWIVPDYGPQSLAAVLPAAVGALGLDLAFPAGSSRQCAQGLGVAWASAQHVVVVVCDGLGMANLQARSGYTPFLRRQLASSRKITTSFPSTTAAALASFGTGHGPGMTGMLGYTLRRPSDGALVNLVSWTQQSDPRRASDPQAGKTAPAWDVDPVAFQPQATVFERLAAHQLAVTSVGKSRFAGSGMTQASLRGARFVGADSLVDAVDATIASALATSGARAGAAGLTYLYWGELDHVAHEQGWTSPAWSDALEDFDRELSRLAHSLPSNCLLMVTADHGHVEVDPAQQVDVAQQPQLAQGVQLLAGEPRVGHVYLLPGHSAQEVAHRWSHYLEGTAVVATRQQAVDAGWFGPVSPQAMDWIGDLVVACDGQASIVDSRTMSPHAVALKGQHGSMTAQEMQVPLIVLAGLAA